MPWATGGVPPTPKVSLCSCSPHPPSTVCPFRPWPSPAEAGRAHRSGQRRGLSTRCSLLPPIMAPGRTGRPRLVGFSTSGDSRQPARLLSRRPPHRGLLTIGFSGLGGGGMAALDSPRRVPGRAVRQRPPHPGGAGRLGLRRVVRGAPTLVAERPNARQPSRAREGESAMTLTMLIPEVEVTGRPPRSPQASSSPASRPSVGASPGWPTRW